MATVMCINILIFYVIIFCSSLKLQESSQEHLNQYNIAKQHSKHESFSSQQALKLYNDDEQIQKIIQQIVKQSQFIKKQTCSTQQTYSYVVIDVPDFPNVRAETIRQKKQVIMTCNIHARQLLATQICLQFLKHLSHQLNYYQSEEAIKYKQKQAQTKSQLQYPQFKHILNILHKIRLTVYYRGNDIRDKVIKERQFCIRKDLNNIDINRNFPTNFNYFNEPKWSDQYPGKQTLSEPFSQCLDNYFKKHNPDIYIDIHTGQFTFFYQQVANKTDDQRTYRILDQVRQKYCKQCRIAAQDRLDQNGKIHDHSDGQIFSDVKVRYKADFSVLFQVFGGFNSQQDQNQNCFTIFNPRTKRQLDYHLQNWSRAIMYFIKRTTLL